MTTNILKDNINNTTTTFSSSSSILTIPTLSLKIVILEGIDNAKLLSLCTEALNTIILSHLKTYRDLINSSSTLSNLKIALHGHIIKKDSDKTSDKKTETKTSVNDGPDHAFYKGIKPLLSKAITFIEDKEGKLDETYKKNHLEFKAHLELLYKRCPNVLHSSSSPTVIYDNILDNAIAILEKQNPSVYITLVKPLKISSLSRISSDVLESKSKLYNHIVYINTSNDELKKYTTKSSKDLNDTITHNPVPTLSISASSDLVKDDKLLV